MKDKTNARGAYAISTISVTLILFLIGSAIHFYWNIKHAADSFVSNIKVTMVLDDNAAEQDVKDARELLDSLSYISETYFVSKDMALDNFSKFVDDDLIAIDGFNPLPASLDIYFNKEANIDVSFDSIKAIFANKAYVDEFLFQTSEVDSLVKNLQSVNVLMGFFGSVLMFISIMLIRNSIKTNIFARRFIIKTMLLIGATEWFVRRPFVGRAILQGFTASLIAYMMIIAMLFFIKSATPLIELLSGLKLHLYIFGVLSIFGITLCTYLTNHMVGKYIRSKNDKLYTF